MFFTHPFYLKAPLPSALEPNRWISQAAVGVQGMGQKLRLGPGADARAAAGSCLGALLDVLAENAQGSQQKKGRTGLVQMGWVGLAKFLPGDAQWISMGKKESPSD